jgi:hypothetical protein
MKTGMQMVILIYYLCKKGYIMADFSNPQNTATPTRTGVIKKKIKKYFYYSVAVLILLVGFWIYWSYYFNYSDGYRAGLLQKFSRKGNIFKTYEGEMVLSSVQSNKNVALASEKFFFSVTEKNLALELDTLQGKTIIVHYKEKKNTLPWRGESTYIVDDAKIAN